MRPCNSRSLFLLLMAGLACLGSPSSVQAQLIAYEGFNYTPGVRLVDQTGGVGFVGRFGENGTGTATIIASGSVPFRNLRTSGNSAQTTSGSPIGNSHTLKTAVGTPGTTVYFSLLARPLDPIGAGEFNGYFGFTFGGLFVGKSAGNFYGMELLGAGGNGFKASNVQAQQNTTVFLVVRARFAAGNDTFELFVNPTPGRPLPAFPNAIKSDLDAGMITEVDLGASTRCQFDEMRVGYTFEDVAPALTRFDFNQDGAADIVWRNIFTGAVACWTMSGSQRLGATVVASTVPLDWKIVGVADFTGDGKPDLLWQNDTTGDVVCWQMDGTTFTGISTLVISHVSTDWKIVGTPDLNGDGLPDTLWQNQTTGELLYWQMNGLQFVSRVILGTTGGVISKDTKVVANADLDGDGKPDLIFQNLVTHTATYWLLNGGYVRTTGTLASGIGDGWQIVAALDINGDKKPEILWQNTQTGQVVYWQMNGLVPLTTLTIANGLTAWNVTGLR